MQKLRRILALLGVVLLAGMYVATLIFALSSNPNAKNMLMAAIACTVIVPCLLYGMMLVTRVLDNRGNAGENAPEKVSGKMPEKASGKTSEKIPGKAPEKASGKASEKIPGKAPEKTSGKASEKIPGETSEKTSEKRRK